MMSWLRVLVQEIHRRSLWQVLAVYAGAGWGALEVVGLFIERGLVPEGTFIGTLVVLVLGLPLVAVTAVIQGGVSGSKSEAADPEEGGALTELGTGERRLRQVFTWRRLLSLGVAAFAILGLGTAGYMAMRVLGIGPPGTLVAQGVIEEGEPVVLADFASSVPGLSGPLLAEALRLNLEQSPTVRPLSTDEMRDALVRMNAEGIEVFHEAQARELAEREGMKAVVAGEASVVGGKVVLTARLLEPTHGRVLATFQERASDTSEVIEALDRLGKSLREKAGESLRSLQGNLPLRRVTTSSLEALRLYSQGVEVERAGDAQRAADLFREAIRIDPDFAMAHRKLAIQLYNSFGSRTEQVLEFTRAYELRDRLPPLERFLADASYFHLVVGELDASARAYRNALDLDPENTVALNNLGEVLTRSGDPAGAESAYRRSILAEPSNANFVNLVRVLYMQGKGDELEEAFREWERQFPGAFEIWRDRGWLLFASGDYAQADSIFHEMKQRFPRNPEARFYGAAGNWVVALVQGKLALADRYGREFVRSSMEVGLARWALNGEMIRSATKMHLEGDLEGAREHFFRALQQYPLSSMAPLDRPYLYVVRSALVLGLVETARSAYSDFLSNVPEEYRGELEDEDPREVEALLAAAEGDTERGVELLERLKFDCTALCRVRVRFSLGELRQAMGDLPGAARAYEEYLSTLEVDRVRVDGFRLPVTLKRLSWIHQALGNQEEANRLRQRLRELWADADPGAKGWVEEPPPEGFSRGVSGSVGLGRDE